MEHDYITMDRVCAAGLYSIDVPSDVAPTDFAADLVSKVVRSNQLFGLLSCLLIPADKTGADWTPELAADTETFLKRLTAPADKQVVHDYVLELLLGFFQAGLASLTTTQSFSQKSE